MQYDNPIVYAATHLFNLLPLIMITTACGLYLSKTKSRTAQILLLGNVLTLIATLISFALNYAFLNNSLEINLYGTLIMLIQVVSYIGRFIFSAALLTLIIKHTHSSTSRIPTPEPQCN